MRRTLTMLIAAVLILTLLLPTGIAAAQAPAVQIVPPKTDTLQFDIGTPDCPVTALPTAKDQWPSEAPENIATLYVWANEPFNIAVTTSYDYHHRGLDMCDHWVDHQPGPGDTETTDITEPTSPAARDIRITKPIYLYFTYYDQPGSYPFHVYAAQVVPVVTSLSAVELATPEQQPESGFPLDETVALKPVWSVGTMSGDTFTEIPNLTGYPDGAGAKWAIEGDPAATNVIQEDDNTTRGDNVAVLVPPADGGEITYTATLVNVLGAHNNTSDMYHPASPASLTVKWSSEQNPEPAGPEPTSPAPEPTAPGPDPSNPPAPAPEGFIPPETSVLQFDIGQPDCPVTALPTAKDQWPQEPPEDIATVYVWANEPFNVAVTTSFDYHHRGLSMCDHWVDRQPDSTDTETTDITEPTSPAAKDIRITEPIYLYFMYYDMPGVYPFHLYAAKVVPVAATVASLSIVSPETEPAGGYAAGEQVVVKPNWTVGTVDADASFSEIPGLSGCPKNGALQWVATADQDTSDNLGAIQGDSDVSEGEENVVLVPRVPCGELTYTASVMSLTSNIRDLYVQTEPASLTVLWGEQDQQSAPIHSAPEAPYSIEIRPNPDGSGTILTGIPIGTDKTQATTVAEFLSQIHAPGGSEVVVKDSDGQPLSGDHKIGTGCEIDVLDAEGNVIFATTVVIRGDVLGTGTLSLAQLTRVVEAYQSGDALSGPYKDAALLLSDAQKVTLGGLVALAQMLKSAA